MIGVLNHVMWRDEFNTWLIVRDSDSLLEMLGHVKYQGHTALWAIGLSFFRNFYDSYIVMQLFHWAIAVAAVTIFWNYSPFTFRQKVLFSFGYIPFYQYSLVTRPYGLGMLFLFVFCAVFPTRKQSYIPATLILALLANSSAYGLLIAIALAATLVIEWLMDANVRSPYLKRARRYDWVVSLVIIGLGFAFAIYILTPPIDSYNHGGLAAWKLDFNLRRALRSWGRIFAAYTLIVPSKYRFFDLVVCGLITLIAIAIFTAHCFRKKVSGIFFVLGNMTLLAFSYLRFAGIGPRHFAHFYLILIAAFWLYAYLPDSNTLLLKRPPLKGLLPLAQKWHQPMLTSILLLQFLGGLYVYPRDLLIPFSASKATVSFIQRSHWQDGFIVASRDANMASISGYLNRKLYYPELEDFGSFTLFGGERTSDNHENYMSHDQVLRQVEILLNTQEEDRILLIFHKPLEGFSESLSIQPVQAFERSWIDSEKFYLYWARLS